MEIIARNKSNRQFYKQVVSQNKNTIMSGELSAGGSSVSYVACNITANKCVNYSESICDFTGRRLY